MAPKTKLADRYWNFLDFFFNSVHLKAFQKLIFPRDVGKHGKKVSALIPGPYVCFVEVFELDYELFGQSKKCTVNSISVSTQM